MPGVQVGVYPGEQTAGTEVSSTYEGRHLTVRDDELIHPVAADTFVNKGDPVVLCDAGAPATYGAAVGVALIDGVVAATEVSLDTEGIWNLQVYAENDLGNNAIEIGDRLYIRAGDLSGVQSVDGLGDAEISKITDSRTQVPFGYALGSMVAGGEGIIAVKVHWDPSLDNEARQWTTVLTGTYGRHKTAELAGGASGGMQYYDQRVTGNQTGAIYGKSSWMELATDGLAMVTDGNLLVARETGIYDAGATLNVNARIVMHQMQAILGSVPGTSFHWWRVNLAAAGGTATALMAAANPASVGLVLGVGVAGVKLGGLPLVDQGGVVYFVRLYSTAL